MPRPVLNKNIFKKKLDSAKRKMFHVEHGDCIKVLEKLNPNQFDAIVTDPPYGLSFMGKGWDYQVPSVDVWRECLRVLKPGGHLLAFSGTRTYHRMVVNIEDAGFEIRDQLQWIYGQGFPKSQDISKAIDKAAGAKREVVGNKPYTNQDIRGGRMHAGTDNNRLQTEITSPATDDAKKWSGWGAALKPANEPICLARKPISESTIAKNVLKHGTGGLNIDGTRVGDNPGYSYPNGAGGSSFSVGAGVDGTRTKPVESTQGRFPSNVILDEDAAKVLDEQSGVLKTNSGKAVGSKVGAKSIYGNGMGGSTYDNLKGDTGGASRFFYVAKASKGDRGQDNDHPTVKPISLMQYLVRMITPPGGVILDPFMGSGTTGVAAILGDYRFFGIDQEKKYTDIAIKRLFSQYFVDPKIFKRARK